MDAKDVSLIVSLVGAIGTALGLLKLLMNQYFKKASELEDIKAANNEKYKIEIGEKFRHLHGHLDLHSKDIKGLQADLFKTRSHLDETDKKINTLNLELFTFRDRKKQMDDIETEVQQLSETFQFIKTKLNKP